MALKAPRTSLTTASVGPTFSEEMLSPGVRLPGLPRPSQVRGAGRLAALRNVFAGDRPGSGEEAYGRAAPGYDGLRWLWLHLGSATAP